MKKDPNRLSQDAGGDGDQLLLKGGRVLDPAQGLEGYWM